MVTNVRVQVRDPEVREALFGLKRGLNAVENMLLVKSVPPTPSDDASSGVKVGTKWVDDAENRVYQCVDNTIDAAVWKEIVELQVEAAGGVGGIASPGGTTAGGLIVRKDSTTWEELVAGVNGEELVSDSTETLGVKWSAGSKGDFIDLIPNEIAIPIVDAGSIVTSVTIDYAALLTDDVILVDASTGDVIVTLPAAADQIGKQYRIKKVDSSANTVTIDGDGAETIDDGAIAVLTTQYEAATLVSDATEWWVL